MNWPHKFAEHRDFVELHGCLEVVEGKGRTALLIGNEGGVAQDVAEFVEGDLAEVGVGGWREIDAAGGEHAAIDGGAADLDAAVIGFLVALVAGNLRRELGHVRGLEKMKK